MLKSLELKNFRGFREHRVDFAPFSLLIGQNNAGKTTLIEALRIIALAQAKAPSANFAMAPDWLVNHISGPIYRVSLSSIGFEHDTVHHQNDSETPAILIAKLSNNCEIRVVIGEEPSEVFCQLTEPGGRKVNNRGQSGNPKFGRVLVMPPVGHVLEHEAPISKTYMEQNLVGYRAHRHIRNQMFEKPDEFKSFKNLIEDSWSLLQVGEVELFKGQKGAEYRISVRDGPFVTELGRQGSGLQAWFQTLWFFARAPKKSVVVLDEPDVYLHADLQRKLLKILGNLGFQQSIVATHSIEMISDVQFEEIISIRKRDKSSKPLTSNDEAQIAADQIGTLHNLQLSKLAASGCVLFLEGKDKSFLSELAYKMGSRIFDKFVSVPSFPVGGFNNWKRATLSAKAFHQASSGRVKSYMILDRDYKEHEEIESISEESNKDNLETICWRKKEIENYLLHPVAIARVVSEGAKIEVSASDISSLLDEIIKELEPDLEAQIAEAIRSNERNLDIPKALARARKEIIRRKDDGLESIDMASGKTIISRLSTECQRKFGSSLNAMSICRSMKDSEIDREISEIIRKISRLQ